MDISGGLGGMDSLMREDSQMFMSADMMALFNDGGVDVNQLFSPEFLQPQAVQQPRTDSTPTQETGFSLLKMNGVATSP